ncbi:MAG: hypothetical protein H0A75_01020 [Candidatus Methanofishera endochildressiae]|uniref:Uncharacterized protein n=1 Tax=Candidatus Methanofishera endochildressiae TaxID=2738884 RepID=A0A7Z0MMM0_9GAMM|nr:hypothetical protein [Candidatus Methanofishera endochildressiae]
MDRINTEVSRSGYQLLNLEATASIQGRCDSFVLKTDVHFPTDISLLYDAMSALCRQCLHWRQDYFLPDWRQHKYNLTEFKRQYRRIQSCATPPRKTKAAQTDLICKAHQTYIDLAQSTESSHSKL